MPIKASYWDAWYEACKDEYFAWGTGGTYWDIPKFTRILQGHRRGQD